MGKLDPRLEKRFRNLETENKTLRQDIARLRGGGQSEGTVRRNINSFLRISTLGRIQNKHLYIPTGKGILPVPRKLRRLL